MIKNTDKVFVAGHKGLIGSAIVRKLKSKGYKILSFPKLPSKTIITNKKHFMILVFSILNLNKIFWSYG